MASQQKSSDTKKQTTPTKAPQPEAPEREQISQQTNAAAFIQRTFSTPQPPPLNPNDILTLQHTIGNRVVNRLLAQQASPHPSRSIQGKPAVGPANEPYEQEADRVAREITRTPTIQRPRPEAEALAQTQPLVQCATEAGEGFEGKLAPYTLSGQELIAHEQTQVRQPTRATTARQTASVQRKDTQHSLTKIVGVGINVANARGNMGQLGHAMDIWIDINVGDHPVTPPNAKPNTIYGLSLEYWEFVNVPHDNSGETGVKPWNDIYAMKPDASTFNTPSPGCDMTWKAAVDAAAAGTLTGQKKIGFRDIPGLFEKLGRNTERTLKFRIVINDGIRPREIFATQVLRMAGGHLGYSAYTDSKGNSVEAHGYGGGGYVAGSPVEQGLLGTEPNRLTESGLPSRDELMGTIPAEAQGAVQSFVEQLIETPGTAAAFNDLEKTAFLAKVALGRQDQASKDWADTFSKELMTDKPGVAAGQFLLPNPAGAQRKQVALPSGGILVAILQGGAIPAMYYTDNTTKTVSLNFIPALRSKNWTLDVRSFTQIPTDMVDTNIAIARAKGGGKFKKARQNSKWNAHLRSFTRQGNSYVVNVNQQIGTKIKKNNEILVDDPEIRDISGQWIKAKFGDARGFIRTEKVTYNLGVGNDVVDDGSAFEDMARTFTGDQPAMVAAMVNYLNIHNTRTPALDIDRLRQNVPNDLSNVVRAYFESQFRVRGNTNTVYDNLAHAYPAFTDSLNPAYQAAFGELQLNKFLLTRETATEVGDIGALQGLARTHTGNHAAMIAAVMNYVHLNEPRTDLLESIYNQHVPPLGLDVPATLGEIANAYFAGYFRAHDNGFAHYNKLLTDYPSLDYRLNPAYRLVFGQRQLQTMLAARQAADFALDVPDPNSVANQDAKRLFLAHAPYTQTDYQPKVGTEGKFDVEFDPATRILKIIVKVAFEFQDSGWDADPSVDPLSKFSRKTWTDPDKLDYKTRFLNSTVTPYNNSGIRIACIRPGWEDIIVTPVFVAQEVLPGSGEHFTNKATKAVVRGSGATAKLQGGRGGAGPGSMMLSEFDVHDKLQDATVHAYLHRIETEGNIEPAYKLDRQRLMKILAQYGQIDAAGYSALAGADRGLGTRNIQDLADQLNRLNLPSALAHLHPIIVEGTAALLPDANAMATFLRGQLVTEGVRNPIQTQGVVGAPAMLKVTAAPEDPAILATYVTNWSRFTSAHEFGHKIGLIDEYYGAASSETVKQMISAGLLPPNTRGDHLKLHPPKDKMVALQAQKQAEQMRALKRTGIESPDLAMDAPGNALDKNPKSTSVMSGGYRVEKQHFLSAWEALVTLTAGEVAEKFWKIT